MNNPFLDRPDWRYGIALKENEREDGDHPLFNPSEDKGVREMKMMLRHIHNRSFDKDRLWESPDMTSKLLAYKIYMDRSTGGYRDIMEAALLAEDCPLEFFQKHVCRGLDTLTVRQYKYMFFDVELDRERRFWVQKNIFAPNKAISNKEKFVSAYMWKIVAYSGGIDKFFQYAFIGAALADDLSAWLRKLGVDAHMRAVLQSIHSNDKLVDGAGTPATMHTAVWHKDSMTTDDSLGNDGDMLTDVYKAIEAAIERPDESVNSELEFYTSNMFENEEKA